MKLRTSGRKQPSESEPDDIYEFDWDEEYPYL